MSNPDYNSLPYSPSNKPKTPDTSLRPPSSGSKALDARAGPSSSSTAQNSEPGTSRRLSNSLLDLLREGPIDLSDFDYSQTEELLRLNSDQQPKSPSPKKTRRRHIRRAAADRLTKRRMQSSTQYSSSSSDEEEKATTSRKRRAPTLCGLSVSEILKGAGPSKKSKRDDEVNRRRFSAFRKRYDLASFRKDISESPKALRDREAHRKLVSRLDMFDNEESSTPRPKPNETSKLIARGSKAVSEYIEKYGLQQEYKRYQETGAAGAAPSHYRQRFTERLPSTAHDTIVELLDRQKNLEFMMIDLASAVRDMMDERTDTATEDEEETHDRRGSRD